MRNPARIPLVLARVEQLWRERPDLRLGQLILNAERDESVLYNIEDDALMDRMEATYKESPYHQPKKDTG